jgi:hypothetical protein
MSGYAVRRRAVSGTEFERRIAWSGPLLIPAACSLDKHG